MLLPMFVHTLLATTGSGVVGPMLMRDPPLFLNNDLLVTCIVLMFFLGVMFDPYVMNFLKTVRGMESAHERFVLNGNIHLVIVCCIYFLDNKKNALSTSTFRAGSTGERLPRVHRLTSTKKVLHPKKKLPPETGKSIAKQGTKSQEASLMCMAAVSSSTITIVRYKRTGRCRSSLNVLVELCRFLFTPMISDPYSILVGKWPTCDPPFAIITLALAFPNVRGRKHACR